MSIIWDWTDATLNHIEHVVAETTCALSGEPLEPPFLLWLGPQVLAINAKAIRTVGRGFELDVAILGYLGGKIEDEASMGRVREMFVRRAKGGDA